MSEYLSKPKTTGAGLLVLHPWWGLNRFMRELCDRLAGAGFVALAPDLYDGKVAGTIPEAEALRRKLDRDQAQERISAAARSLQATVRNRPVGAIGFSMGAHWALWLAEQPEIPLQAVVIFYGNRGGEYRTGPGAFLGHFAETDTFVASSGVRRLEKALLAAGKEAEFYTYPGTSHWFFENDRPEFQPEAAALAWRRTRKFLKVHLA